jgi:AraC family transcriptional regulator
MLTNSSPTNGASPAAIDGCIAEPADRDPPPRSHASVTQIHPAVEISPPDIVRRRAITWHGMAAETVQSTRRGKVEYRFRAPMHLLVVYEEGERRDGETLVEGLPESKLRNFARKLTFVPAGHDYHEWYVPLTRRRRMHVYIDPATLPQELSNAGMSFAPRLFFEDATLWHTALKLRRLVENPASGDRPYAEALGIVLVHELVRLNSGTPREQPQFRGGLAAWQQRLVTAYIEDHLAERIPLATLAQLVRLSPHHFCRAFKQSFDMPPHRYHTARRMEHAKALLARPAVSVTDIGLTMGFSSTSSFTATFRKTTGVTPTDYHRNLG